MLHVKFHSIIQNDSWNLAWKQILEHTQNGTQDMVLTKGDNSKTQSASHLSCSQHIILLCIDQQHNSKFYTSYGLDNDFRPWEIIKKSGNQE